MLGFQSRPGRDALDLNLLVGHNVAIPHGILTGHRIAFSVERTYRCAVSSGREAAPGLRWRSEMAPQYDALQYPAETTLANPGIARTWPRDSAVVALATVAAAAFAYFGGAVVLLAILAITVLAPVIALVLGVLAIRSERRRLSST
jgi:hypothetical protein